MLPTPEWPVTEGQTHTVPERSAAVNQMVDKKRICLISAVHQGIICTNIMRRKHALEATKFSIFSSIRYYNFSQCCPKSRKTTTSSKNVELDKWCSTAGGEQPHGCRQRANKGSVSFLICFLPQVHGAHWRWKGYFNAPLSLAMFPALPWGDGPWSIRN